MKPGSAEKIRVCLVGEAGRMGSVMDKACCGSEDIEIVAAVDREHSGKPLSEVTGSRSGDLMIEDKVGAALDRSNPHVLLDFTHPGAAADHAISALKRQVAPVI